MDEKDPGLGRAETRTFWTGGQACNISEAGGLGIQHGLEKRLMCLEFRRKKLERDETRDRGRSWVVLAVLASERTTTGKWDSVSWAMSEGS